MGTETHSHSLFCALLKKSKRFETTSVEKKW